MAKPTEFIFNTTCSGCMCKVRVNRVAGFVVSGKDASQIDNDDSNLITWDCPLCGYADSFDMVDGVKE